MSNPSPCRSCERVDENALFCPHCGLPLEDEEPTTDTQSEDNSETTKTASAAVFFLTLLLAGALMLKSVLNIP